MRLLVEVINIIWKPLLLDSIYCTSGMLWGFPRAMAWPSVEDNRSLGSWVLVGWIGVKCGFLKSMCALCHVCMYRMRLRLWESVCQPCVSRILLYVKLRRKDSSGDSLYMMLYPRSKSGRIHQNGHNFTVTLLNRFWFYAIQMVNQYDVWTVWGPDLHYRIVPNVGCTSVPGYLSLYRKICYCYWRPQVSTLGFLNANLVRWALERWCGSVTDRSR